MVFVQDYLQLVFQNYTLNCYNWPTVIVLNSIFDINNKEYQNALCSLIIKVVSNTNFIENEMLEIDFQSGEQIIINLKYAKGEVIYFTNSEGEWSSI